MIILCRACLAATIRSSGASQSTIKVVATNLIANSRLMGEYNDHMITTVDHMIMILQKVYSC